MAPATASAPLFWISAAIIAVVLAAALFPSLFTSKDPRACDANLSVLRPSGEHWFGTDIQGCDYYARIVYGARNSVIIGVAVTITTVVIAVVLGSIAGYYGRFVDTAISRLTDIWFAVPIILGAIVLQTALGGRSRNQLILALTVFGWPPMLRLMRSQVLATKEVDYVDAARALGASGRRIIVRHILPNAIAPVIVYATISIGVIITAEATLSFLGVGLQLPDISWGLAINQAEGRIRSVPHLLFFPGAALAVTVFAFILLGDVLRDALDPKLR